MAERERESATETIGFLLLPKFPMLAFSAAIEPLRIANWISGRPLYGWRVFTADGAPVRASNGILVTPDAAIAETDRFPVMLVCAGVEGCYYRDRRVFAWLRSLARHGGAIGGIGTASYALARAGLLEGHRCTIHWEDLEGFRAEFPQLEVTTGLFEIDGLRLTCAGGTAALDMILSLVAARHGQGLAGAIAEQFMQHRLRGSEDQQRTTLQFRTGVSDRRLLAAIDAMETHLEDPVPLSALCDRAGLSVRHMQRLFQEHFAASPSDFYRAMRLRQARQMLLHGSNSILEVAVATGFVSCSHFTRRYRELFGITPREERRRQRAARQAARGPGR